MALPSYIILNIFSRANLNFSAVYRETGNVQSSCLHSCHPKNPTVHSCYRLNKDRTPWKQRYLPTASTCLEEKKYELFCVITLLYYLSCQLILYVNNKPISAQQILGTRGQTAWRIYHISWNTQQGENHTCSGEKDCTLSEPKIYMTYNTK